MKEIIKQTSYNRPNKIERLGDGTYYYNYDIKEEDNLDESTKEQFPHIYTYIQAYLRGIPNYKDCLREIIRLYVDQDTEFNLINEYNSYNLNIDSSTNEYEEYLQLIKQIKQKVYNDFSIEKPITLNNPVKQIDVNKVVQMIINQAQLTDNQSLEVKSLYPQWESYIGKQLEKDMKVQYNDKLFKVVQAHTAQIGWEPSINTASLFTEIVEDHAGTLEDPIPYPADGNMIIYNGKYYLEDGIIYLCNRDSQQPLYTKLASVIDIYVIKIEQ